MTRIALHVFGDGDHPETGRPQADLLRAACAARGWPCRVCSTSAEILDFAPDLVLSLTMMAPKLTALPTVAVLWDHEPCLEDRPAYIRYILSCDAHVAPETRAARYVRDLMHAARRPCRLIEAPFSATRRTTPPPADPALMIELAADADALLMPLMHLADRMPLAVYGPAEPWAALGPSWRGEASASLFAERLARHGRLLHLCSPTEWRRGVPAPGFFQALAMGAPVIADAHPWIAAHCAAEVAQLPASASPMRMIEAIAEAAARSDAAMTERATHRFASEWAAERLLDRLPLPAPVASPSPETRVDYIVRVGGRPVSTIARALDSLAAQTHRAIRPILVSYRPVAGLDGLIDRLRPRFPDIALVDVSPARMRSNTLWAGLRAIESEYFGVLDDDDALQPDHVATLLAVLRRGDAGLAYSGAVRVLESQNTPGRSAGPAENRDLAFLEPFIPARILRDNFIVSNAWLARRDLLDDALLDDPELNTGEDFLLLLEMLDRTDFVPSWRPTAEFFWREDSADHSRRDPEEWRQGGLRNRRRLLFARFAREALDREWRPHGIAWEAEPKRFVPLIARTGDSLDAIRARHPGRTISATADVVDAIAAGEGLAEGAELRLSIDTETD